MRFKNIVISLLTILTSLTLLAEDPYEILELKQSASKNEIKKRCREAYLKYHPDKHIKASPKDIKKIIENFIAISSACATLQHKSNIIPTISDKTEEELQNLLVLCIYNHNDKNNYTKIIEHICNTGINLNFYYTPPENHNGYIRFYTSFTPLHIALEMDTLDYDIIETLLKNKASVNILSINGKGTKTPFQALMYRIANQPFIHSQSNLLYCIAELLLTYKADPFYSQYNTDYKKTKPIPTTNKIEDLTDELSQMPTYFASRLLELIQNYSPEAQKIKLTHSYIPFATLYEVLMHMYEYILSEDFYNLVYQS